MVHEIARVDFEHWQRNCETLRMKNVVPEEPLLALDIWDSMDPLEVSSFADSDEDEVVEEEEVVAERPVTRAAEEPAERPAKKARFEEKCPQAVDMRDAVFYPEIDLSAIPVLPRRLAGQKIMPRENYKVMLRMKEHQAEMERLGIWAECERRAPPRIPRPVFVTDSKDAAVKKAYKLANRKASDVYSRQFFAWNKTECERMAKFLRTAAP